MKKVFLIFVLIFSFNLVNAQYITTITPEPLIQKECVPGKNAFTYWADKLMDPKITSYNTSIEEWRLEGNTYFVIKGEEGKRIDDQALLIKVIGSCWKVVKNLRDSYYDPTGQIYLVDISVGDVVKRVDFYREAKFIGYIFQKFPNDVFWKPKTNY